MRKKGKILVKTLFYLFIYLLLFRDHSGRFFPPLSQKNCLVLSYGYGQGHIIYIPQLSKFLIYCSLPYNLCGIMHIGRKIATTRNFAITSPMRSRWLHAFLTGRNKHEWQLSRYRASFWLSLILFIHFTYILTYTQRTWNAVKDTF